MSPTVLSTEKYLHELVKAISASKKRVVLSAMVGIYDSTTAPIFEAVRQALGRGVQVHLLFDVYSNLSIAQHTFPFSPTHGKKTNQVLQELQEQGAQVSVVGHIELNPFKNRYHAKLNVIDDTWFSFGGINIIDADFQHTDYMLTGRDAKVADKLANIAKNYAEQKITKDFSEKLDEKNTLLFDAGTPGVSIIYDTACTLASLATEIVLVSQWVPTGRLAEIVKTKKYQCFFNPPLKSEFPANFAQLVDGWRVGLKNNYEDEKFLHAKYMLLTMPDGSKAVLTGSHNFTWRGVAYGTAEIALFSTDKKLWQDLYDFSQQLGK